MKEPSIDDLHLDPTDANVAALMARNLVGPVDMLNLVRLREVADYSGSPELAPSEPISGRAAFDLYIQHTLLFLRGSGGELLYLGAGGPYLVGSPRQGWDLTMLVRQTSIESFLGFTMNHAYLAGVVHRTAAVMDSRILPLVDATPPAGGWSSRLGP